MHTCVLTLLNIIERIGILQLNKNSIRQNQVIKAIIRGVVCLAIKETNGPLIFQ